MSKKNYIALADLIISLHGTPMQFSENQISRLADFCNSQGQMFNYQTFFGYIERGIKSKP